MQSNNPTYGNAPGLPELLNHIGEVQNKTCTLSGLLKAFAYLEAEQTCLAGRAAIAQIAEDLAEQINRDLDIVTLLRLSQ